VRLVAVTQVLVKVHGPWVVIDNAENHPLRLLISSSILGCCDEARCESMTPPVFANRQVTELPFTWFGGLCHGVTVGKDGYCGDDVVVISDDQRLTYSRREVAQGFGVWTPRMQMTTVDIGLDREVRDY